MVTFSMLLTRELNMVAKGGVVSPDYGERGNEFSGQVNWVQIDLEKDDHDHLISPDERFSIAMARQ
jgi:arylsulfatase